MVIKVTRDSIGNQSKVDRYKWPMLEEPGVFLEIPKDDLNIDPRYQRDLYEADGATIKKEFEAKIRYIASHFSWPAFGVLTVADRKGVYYVIDGQNRTLASKRRADITNLPCIVFETSEVQCEAQAFLDSNTRRNNVSSVAKFNALITMEDEKALFIQGLCARSGRVVTTNASPNAVRCVRHLMVAATVSEDRLSRLWPLMNEIMAGIPWIERLSAGMFWIEERMPEGQSLTDRRWRERLLKAGHNRLLQGTYDAQAFYKVSGAKTWGNGIVEAMNHKAQNRLILRSTED